MPSIIDSQLKSNNFTKGRKGPYPVDRIVIHVMEGTESASQEWFENEASDVSSNYGVRKDGGIERYVAEHDTAWTQGRVYRPTAKVVLERPDANPNSYCISIECEGSGKESLTNAQRESVVWLINDIRTRNPLITLDRDHIIGHNEIYAKKTCPGAISVTQLVQLAKVAQGDKPLATSMPRLVYSEYLEDWLVVTRVVSDDEWYFYPLKELTRGTRAKARLSQMPLKPSA